MNEPQHPVAEPAGPSPAPDRPGPMIPRPAGPPTPARLRAPYDARQPGESGRAFAAFRAYLEMGEFRSIDEVGRDLYPGDGSRRRGRTGRLAAWARRWGWARRVELIEGARAEYAREVQQEAIRESVRAQVAAMPPFRMGGRRR